jgi:hypothetical protein
MHVDIATLISVLSLVATSLMSIAKGVFALLEKKIIVGFKAQYPNYFGSQAILWGMLYIILGVFCLSLAGFIIKETSLALWLRSNLLIYRDIYSTLE